MEARKIQTQAGAGASQAGAAAEGVGVGVGVGAAAQAAAERAGAAAAAQAAAERAGAGAVQAAAAPAEAELLNYDFFSNQTLVPCVFEFEEVEIMEVCGPTRRIQTDFAAQIDIPPLSPRNDISAGQIKKTVNFTDVKRVILA